MIFKCRYTSTLGVYNHPLFTSSSRIRTSCGSFSTLSVGFDQQVNLVNHSIRSTGLFGYPSLTEPQGLAKAAQLCIQQATQLVELVCQAESDEEIRKTIKRVDAISDVLCSVLDPSEFIRNVHPDESYVAVADNVSTSLHSFLSQLNTHQGLYLALGKVLSHPEIFKYLSEHEMKVATLLIQDFEKSGVHMSLSSRQKFIDLNDEIQTLGQTFSNQAYPSSETVSFDNPNLLRGAPTKLLEALTQQYKRKGKITIPTSSEIASILLRTCTSEEARKTLFEATNSGSSLQVETLEGMLKKRAQLAELLGKRSYAEMYLVDKLAKTPENVVKFLEDLSISNRPLAQRELSLMTKAKDQETSSMGSVINAWDRSFYGQSISNRFSAENRFASQFAHISSYFSVGNTFSGLSSVFEKLYGIRLELEETVPGEVWHQDVRKLSVVHESEGVIGIIYCDLFEREGNIRKYENAAHFTIRCSRRIDNDDAFLNTPDLRNAKYEKVVSNHDGRTAKHQIPIVVLVTSFSRPNNGVPSLLGLNEIETLFHEMGHAMHSMLAQTDFQHISGTRVPMDFVEVPSILMEFFAHSPQVLKSFGKHYKTGEAVPEALLKVQLDGQTLMQALENQTQIQMALLDQAYHSELASSASFDSSKLLYDISAKFNSIPLTSPSKWQVQFSHLFTYGATYYSYLWSRRWATKIHENLFARKTDPEWREGGEIIRKLLATAAIRDPSNTLTQLLPKKDQPASI